MPPKVLAFYQTKIFGEESHLIYYFTKVKKIQKVFRRQLFPNEPENKKSNREYYQLIIDPLERLKKPIVSRRWRRIVFISTTWEKFTKAIEINDLFDDSPLEDRLWAELIRQHIPAERQEFIPVENRYYALDFTVYCTKNNINIETDGDSWHANPAKAAQDNRRDNALESRGWKVLRFTSHQIMEETEKYCIKTIAKTINNSGGLKERNKLPRKIQVTPDGSYQTEVFNGKK